MMTREIANEIKKTIEGIDENKMREMMMKHYKLMHLIDNNGNWATPRLQMIGDKILPNDMTEEKTKAFIDEMADAASENPFLVSFLEKAKNSKFDRLQEKVNKEGKKVFPDVIAYSIVLEKLTKEMYKDYKVMEDCHDVFVKARKDTKSFNELDTFMKIKLLSVEKPIRNYIKIHKSGIDKPGVVKPTRGKYLLALNIIEATVSDIFSGNFSNAKTGWTLAINHAGSKEYNKNTEGGPSGYSENKKAVTYFMPMPKKWTDLYQTWNMAFVSKLSDFPYWIPKLCIPQVAKYQKKPEEFIYNRALALYLTLNHASFDYVERKKNNEPIVDWRDDKLTKEWGRENEESTKKYNSELAARKRMPIGKVIRNIDLDLRQPEKSVVHGLICQKDLPVQKMVSKEVDSRSLCTKDSDALRSKRMTEAEKVRDRMLAKIDKTNFKKAELGRSI